MGDALSAGARRSLAAFRAHETRRILKAQSAGQPYIATPDEELVPRALANVAGETRREKSNQSLLKPLAPSREDRLKARARQRASGCRQRARQQGIPFDEAIVELAGDEIEKQGFCCAATGHPFDIDTIGEGAGGSHFAPSPDRIEPSKGYVPGNVRWVLWMVNRAKGRMTDEQLLTMCRAIASRE